MVCTCEFSNSLYSFYLNYIYFLIILSNISYDFEDLFGIVVLVSFQ